MTTLQMHDVTQDPLRTKLPSCPTVDSSLLKVVAHRSPCDAALVAGLALLESADRAAAAIPPLRSKRPRSLTAECNAATPILKKKSLSFTSATTFVFPVAYGGSAIPETAGPPIGLATHHVTSSTIDLSSISPRRRYERTGVHRFSHLERVRLLKAAKYTGRDIACFCSEAMDIRSSREETQEDWYRANKDAAADVGGAA
ncbi:Aste57867_17831 [Aphanomyces stellatus]|uniref:Aste57867_17831 protein n=1 Tax=Aphanomyces stellatus TaxID=120398 RepID=A0A485LC78_9STRA|nr:hypothetical protein As57867_017770 [Aphanomyces stellatus]VFT94574.1 Aste57867_17831 [Aphanomyces stellatus]